MRIRDIAERSVAISRYGDPAIASGGLTTSIVRLTVDAPDTGKPVTGYGFASIGRFAQGGLLRDRFIPRLRAAAPADLVTGDGGNLDPAKCWQAMMRDEKPGGHGERCVAVGALDMAIWDAAAKIAGLPLWRFIRHHLGRSDQDAPPVDLYASGGYPYPQDDLARLEAEIRGFLDQGYQRVKIKIAAAGDDARGMDRDLRRIETVLGLLPSSPALAVDAMNRYGADAARQMAARLAGYDLLWFEDPCDPHDFATQAAITTAQALPIAVGEALFSRAEAQLLLRHGGLRPERDILLFDPAHCYGLTHYLQMIAAAEEAGWSRRAFWPHGGHLFSLHVAAALGLGGSEVNPVAFQPFGGLADGQRLMDGRALPPELPGIGLEGRAKLAALLGSW
ncbi:MAG TPA: enolase C-terminal domain-like protein [Dongiaceae bacterium]|nr:enolase C-terminal domain-like protein [Dongiaceae bacterium]